MSKDQVALITCVFFWHVNDMPLPLFQAKVNGVNGATGRPAAQPALQAPQWEGGRVVLSRAKETPLRPRTARSENVQVCCCQSLINCISFSNYIFVVVHAQWQEWGQWSGCTATCGNGTQVRARACGEAEYGGDEVCHGDSTETQDCTVADCPSEFQHQMPHYPKTKSVDLPYLFSENLVV